MKAEIETILTKVLPAKAFIEVSEGKIMGDRYIRISIAASSTDIHNVQGQKPQLVSLMLFTDSLELRPQVFGGNGGQCIYRKPNISDSKEKYLAMKSVRIPFRRPITAKVNVLAAIEKFASKWLELLKENRDVLMYQDLVDYDVLFNS